MHTYEEELKAKKLYYIYLIYHRDEKKFPYKRYVGRTNTATRLGYQHFNPNYWKNYPNKALYQAFQKDGIENYTYRILETCISVKESKEQEEYWINKLQTLVEDGGLNMRHEIT